MVFSLNEDDLKSRIAEALKEADKIYPAIGLFTRWFNAVELQISRLLAHVLDMREFERFELLARGLMPRQKVESLKKACGAYYPLDEALIARLEYFEKRCVKMRNQISHSNAMPEADRIHFGSIGEMPGYADDPTRPMKKRPTCYTIKEIFIDALWLRDFYYDLDVACVQTWNRQDIRIDNPRSTLPQ